MSDPTQKPFQGRFGSRPADPAIDFSAFKAELEASLKHFDEKAALHTDPPRPASPLLETPPNTFPVLVLPESSGVASPESLAPQSENRPVSPSTTPVSPTPALSSLDLLAELRREAQAKVRDDGAAEVQKQLLIERSGQALRSLLRYVGELCKHLDTIHPPVPRSFLPLPRIALNSLHWSDSFIDFRTNGGTEISPLESVSLRYTLSAGDSILVEKLPNYASAYHDELKRFGLRYTTTEKRGTRGLVEQIDFLVARELSVSLQFKADPETQLIQLRARNFTELDTQFYSISVEAVTPQWLDEMGKHILGRPSRVFESLQRC